MKRTFELYEIEASMLPIFEDWWEIANLKDTPNFDDEVVAYGLDKNTHKYIALYAC
jgi:hypothetical protein